VVRGWDGRKNAGDAEGNKRLRALDVTGSRAIIQAYNAGINRQDGRFQVKMVERSLPLPPWQLANAEAWAAPQPQAQTCQATPRGFDGFAAFAELF
jgi:hypothetical protein